LKDSDVWSSKIFTPKPELARVSLPLFVLCFVDLHFLNVKNDLNGDLRLCFGLALRVV
jgi:hypothetical protein